MKYKIKLDSDGKVVRKMTLKNDEVLAIMGTIGLTCQNDRAGMLPPLQDIPQTLYSDWATAERSCFPNDSPCHNYRKKYTGELK
jgi:hypothetical protein